MGRAYRVLHRKSHVTVIVSDETEPGSVRGKARGE
jgi:ribosomal protein L22